MIESYQSSIINNRGIYQPSAGKQEFELSNKYKSYAKYLAPHYPKTSKIYYSLSEFYTRESERERRNAEHFW